MKLIEFARKLILGSVLGVLFFPFVFLQASALGQSRSLDLSADNPHWIPKLGSGAWIPLTELLDFRALSGVKDYQIGDEWGKQAVDPAKLSQRDAVYLRAVQATAFFNSATSFYLGKFFGKHVMATNHHVLGFDADCAGHTVNFTLRNKKYRCKEMIGSWSEIDLALFTLEEGSSADRDLLSFAKNFDFKTPLEMNTQLLTAGFGIAGNSGRQMMANENSDCRVLSQRDEFRLMADPDQYNPADYKTWSFSTGCGVSHGDSGSAMVDRRTGAVVGIVWTGAIPKALKVQRSVYLKEIQSRHDEEIWTLLTYAVPAAKIGEKLQQVLLSGELSGENSAIVRELLAGG